MSETASRDGKRVFSLVADQNWWPLGGVAPLTLELSSGNTNVTGRLNGLASNSPMRLNWLRFDGSISGATANAGRFSGTITYNQISPGAFDMTCDAPGMEWSLVEMRTSP